jgi:hypothetical protein
LRLSGALVRAIPNIESNPGRIILHPVGRDACARDIPRSEDQTMTADDQTGDQDGGATTVDDSTDTSTTTDTSATDSSSGDSGSSDSSSSDAGSADSGSSDSGSSDSGSTGAGGSGASDDQTPAADLTVADIQPASADADSALSSAGSDMTSAGATDTVAADAEGGGGGGGSVSLGDLVTLGKAVASIMTASEATYDMKSNPVTVLPQGKDPSSITGISSDPHELRLVVSMSNRAGMEMCNLPIVVQWRYGGQIGGKGRFITNASAFMDSGADVGAFYRGEVTAALKDPFNAGSDASDPIASVDVHIEVKVTDKISPANLFVVLEGNIRGDGAGALRRRPD